MGNKRGTVVNHNYTKKSYSQSGYKSFAEFYPFYLGEHCNKTNRRLHIVATSNAAVLFVVLILTLNPIYALLAAVQAYGLAWIGHYMFEKNKPATFSHPLYSAMGDITMWWEVVSGARQF